MKLNRRELLTGAIGLASATALSRVCFSPTAFAAVSPAELAADPRRPQYHLLPKANWMNDPNGPIFWNGNYHMFYQYNPDGAYWGDMHWGHAISPDMVHWQHLPVALAPTPGGPDADGCFSGTAVIDGGAVAMIYTGVVSVPESEATIRDGVNSFRESQCLAFGSGEDLTTWKKYPQPVIAAPPPGLDITGFRDPSPWRHGNGWYMTVGSGIRGKGGAVLLYHSDDLRHWDYLHILTQGDRSGKDTANPVDSGTMWECPDFFPLGDKHVLIYSAKRKAFWLTGVLDPETMLFHPERNGLLDYGSLYAPKTQLDKDQNRILWGWITESRPLEAYRASGWASMMSLPRILTLDKDSNLHFAVSPAVDQLRQSPQTLRISKSQDENRRQIARMHIESCCGEILCIAKAGNGPFGLSIIGEGEANAVPWLTVQYDPSQPGHIRLDDKDIPFQIGAAGELELHFYIDGSVIEAFINNQVACSKRFYFSGSTAPRASLQLNGDTTGISSLSLWQITPISANRLTT